MTKELHKAITKRSRLIELKQIQITSNVKEIFVKNFRDLRKKSHYRNVGLKKVADKIFFLRTITPFVTKIPLRGGKINFTENGNKVSSDTYLYRIFNCFNLQFFLMSNTDSKVNIPY